MGVIAPVAPPVPGESPPPDRIGRIAVIVGVILYAAGTLSFTGIAVAFFLLRMYEVDNDSRVAFIVLFSGMFATLQGLVFVLVARGSEMRRQVGYAIQQVRALYAAPPGSRYLPPRDEA